VFKTIFTFLFQHSLLAWHLSKERILIPDPVYVISPQNTFAVKKGTSKKLQVSVTLYMKVTGNLKS